MTFLHLKTGLTHARTSKLRRLSALPGGMQHGFLTWIHWLILQIQGGALRTLASMSIAS